MTPRWQATIVYRTNSGPVDTVHTVNELEEIADLVERGPHWDTVIKIEITRINHNESETLTIEQAARL